MNGVFGAIAASCRRINSLSKKAVSTPMAVLAEKNGDMKVKKAATECMMCLAEVATPQFVASQLYKVCTLQLFAVVMFDASVCSMRWHIRAQR